MNTITEKDFREHAEREYPRECCGVIAIVKGREKYFPCANKSASNDHFIMSAEDYAEVEDLGEIISILHSHPDYPANPSTADKVVCETTGLQWHIVRVDKENGVAVSKDIVSFSPSGYVAPLVGREFSHGVLDCYSVIRDWYKQERGITLMQFERADDWWNDGKSDLYTEGFPLAGGVSVGPEATLEIGDVILMQIRSKNSVPNHAAVYIGNSQILHHMYGRLSSRDIYGGFWREVTRDIIRYRG